MNNEVITLPPHLQKAHEKYQQQYALLAEYIQLKSCYDDAISSMHNMQGNNVEGEIKYARKAAGYKYAMEMMKRNTNVHVLCKEDILQEELSQLLEYLAFD
jgi:hypothetical protein